MRNWKRYQKAIGLLVAMLAFAMLFVACDQNSVAPMAKSLTVMVSEQNAKTISPSGNVNISHYVITVSNQDTGDSVNSGYLKKGQTFSVMNIAVGTWVAKVDAYVQNEYASGGYVHVATAMSDPVRVDVDSEAKITVTLDEILAAPSDDVSIALMLPSDFLVGENAYVIWSLDGDQNDYSLTWDKALELQVSEDRSVSFTLDADNLLGNNEQLLQGVYTITVEVSDSKSTSSQTVVKKGVEVLRLLAGLPASGVINLAAETIADGMDITITDQIGDKLQLGASEISNDGSVLTLNLGYNGIPLDTPVTVYVDESAIGVTSDETTDGPSYTVEDMTDGRKFVINGLEAGEHMITFSVDDGTALGGGSLTVKVVMAPAKVATPEIVAEKSSSGYAMFTVSCNTPDAVIRYTLDGTIPDETSSSCSNKLSTQRYAAVFSVKAWKDGLEPSDITSIKVEYPPIIILSSQQVLFIKSYYINFINRFDSDSVLAYRVNDSYDWTYRIMEPEESTRVSRNNSGYFNVCVYKFVDGKRVNGWEFKNISYPPTSISGGSGGRSFYGTPMTSIQLATPSITQEGGIVTITNQFPGEVEHTYYKIDDGEYQEYTEPFQMEASGTVTAYCTGTGYSDSSKNSIDVVIPVVGDTITVDDIEVLIIATKDAAGAWSTTAGAKGAEYIGVDKNHDLSYYISGDDYVNQSLPIESAKYGYEWGAYNIETGVKDTEIGTGLENTNALIAMGLAPNTEGWYVVWDKVEEFRQNHSDKWFVPSKDELSLIYENRSSLSNLSVSTRPYYWSSSESSAYSSKNSPIHAYFYYFNNGNWTGTYKKDNERRTRLCVQFTIDDIQ